MEVLHQLLESFTSPLLQDINVQIHGHWRTSTAKCNLHRRSAQFAICELALLISYYFINLQNFQVNGKCLGQPDCKAKGPNPFHWATRLQNKLFLLVLYIFRLFSVNYKSEGVADKKMMLQLVLALLFLLDLSVAEQCKVDLKTSCIATCSNDTTIDISSLFEYP